MALINGTNYDHIDLQAEQGGDTVRHMLQDTKAREDVSELKSDLNDISSDNYTWIDFTPTSFVDDAHIMGVHNAYLGESIYSTAYKHTNFLDISDYSKIKVDIPYTTASIVGIAFYNSNKTAISGYTYVNKVPSTEIHGEVIIDIPANTVYARISVRKTVEEYFYCEGLRPKIDLIDLKVSNLGTEIKNTKTLAERRYMADLPSKVLMPEFASHFWCANYMPNALSGKAVVMTVSGSAGDDYLTVTNIEPDTVAVTDIISQTGFVLTEDGTHYSVYNARYNSTTEKLEIYPKLNKNIVNATFASLFLDGGASYAGMHLTAHGFKAYVEHMYSQNPKHCEIGLYNEAFDSRTLGVSSKYPFRKIGTGNLWLEISSANLCDAYLKNYFPMHFNAIFVSSYAPYTAKNGVYWNVDLNGTSGYLELIMNAIAPTLDSLPEGQEVYVDVYIDGTLKSQTVITDPIGKRICVDYENATSGRLEIYCNKWAAISGSSSGFEISKAVWWINEMKYPENAKMFPKGVFVAQEFDSWGVYSNGITGTTLKNFISADAGVTVPLENHSLSSQTTAWGLAYWYQNVLAYHPAIAITDFGINDSNSVFSPEIPETITGPDGEVYNNKITQEMFVENTGKLIDFAVNNGIQPIVMRNFQHFYYTFIDAAIEGLSHKYGE